MALQNIGAGNRDDAFYRYKMPRMITKIEGRGNGIKTNVVNMVEIAKALARPASYPTKYFGNELGAQSKFDEKTGTSHVNGSHDTAKLAGLLENFIKKYVQCYGCGNPETEITITKTQMVTLKCAACGFISDVDMRDKLITFIIKNPPVQKKGGKDKKAMRRAEKERLKEGEAADEEQKKLKKEAAKKKTVSTKSSSSKKAANISDDDHSSGGGSQGDDHEPVIAAAVADDDDDEDDVQWQTDTSAEAAKKRMAEQLSSATAEMVMLSTIEEKAKPVKKIPEPELKPKPAATENINGSCDPHVTLVTEIKQQLDNGATAAQLKSFMASVSSTFQEKMNALFIALFEGIGKGFEKKVTGKKSYIVAAAVGQEDSAESQMVLLRAIEFFCEKASPEAVKEVPLLLKRFYDADILEEEHILSWYQQGLAGSANKSPIWKASKPFIEWLQSAESESEEE
uniref:W2 domain-containing protein n=1 Tax=Kalanchoe fedtschenkoi TaxID=63787 RepID=A0A7N0TL38_KALFE